MVQISLCIPTMGRWIPFLSQNLPKYLENPYISEIVICDETGEDAKQIFDTFKDNPKIRVFVNEKRLGAYRNKEKAVSLAKNDFVCLMDSDNFAPESYFEAWFRHLNGSAPEEHMIYMPCRTIPQPNHDGFNFSKFSGKTFTKDTFKELHRDHPVGDTACNVGNYIVPKKMYIESIPPSGLERFVDTCSPVDVLFKNYILWKNGASAVFVPGMEYHHAVHSGSLYIQTSKYTDLKFFASLYA